jgi:hypothetical protein
MWLLLHREVAGAVALAEAEPGLHPASRRSTPVHSQDNSPPVVTVRGSGVIIGEHINSPDRTPLCNLWLTIVKGSGVNVEKFGGSTGTLDAL